MRDHPSVPRRHAALRAKALAAVAVLATVLPLAASPRVVHAGLPIFSIGEQMGQCLRDILHLQTQQSAGTSFTISQSVSGLPQRTTDDPPLPTVGAGPGGVRVDTVYTDSGPIACTVQTLTASSNGVVPTLSQQVEQGSETLQATAENVCLGVVPCQPFLAQVQLTISWQDLNLPTTVIVGAGTLPVGASPSASDTMAAEVSVNSGFMVGARGTLTLEGGIGGNQGGGSLQLILQNPSLSVS